MNTIVSFEIAKLLKEKGFEGKTKSYNEDGKLVNVSLSIRRFNPERIYYPAPTIAEVVMWLYEKHGIWVNVEYMDDILLFCFSVCTIKTNTNEMEQLGFNTPADAYEAAIEYCLVNLIKEENENNWRFK